ncbi:hypothetical protein [Pseudomonas sp. 2FE]|uniref:hypothetical protein n=1 Tax=Pseudomonas sp. 2FE TaxID=2502190 RepID=UPI0010F4E1BE|nr:hypothetical protein [Pseudomonas sp. 2FE]
MSSRLLAISLSALLATTLPAFTASAAAPTDNLLKLHQLRLAAQKSLGDFYMYNGMEGDQRYARMIEESLQDASSRLNEITEMPGEASKALRAQLGQQWSDYAGELKNLTSTLKNQGFTDLQPIANLATRNQQLIALSSELYSKIQQESGLNVPPLTQQSREQSLLMQAIAVDYASRSASVGGTFFGGGGESQSIDQLVDEFAGKLTSMERAAQNTPQIRQSLGGINTKWRYIEKSLKNYNENSVPFVVNKYSDSIIDGLEGVSAQYAAAKL